MKQHHPRQDGSGGNAGARSGIARQDLMRKARHLAEQVSTARWPDHAGRSRV